MLFKRDKTTGNFSSPPKTTDNFLINLNSYNQPAFKCTHSRCKTRPFIQNSDISDQNDHSSTSATDSHEYPPAKTISFHNNLYPRQEIILRKGQET